MPSDAQTVRMKPGSVLYLPGGWWHTTEDGKDGLSLSFALRRERYFERALRMMREKFIADDHWREPVSPLSDETTEAVMNSALKWLEKQDESD